MICFKDLGCCLDIDNEWQKTEKVFEDIKPYVYQGFEKNGNYLYLHDYGYHNMEAVDTYLEYKFADEQNLQNQTIYAKLDSRIIEDFEQKYYEALFFDKEKQVYNLRFYATFSKKVFSFGCIDIYFQDYSDLEEMQKIIYEKFSFIKEK